jgi:hypothetical protein
MGERQDGAPPFSRRSGRLDPAARDRGKAEVRVLRGGLALDPLYLLARDVDRAGEPVGLEYPAFDHIQDLPAAEAEILGRLHHGDLLAAFVFHPKITSSSGKERGQDTPKDTAARLVSKAASLSSETTLEDAQDAQHHVGHY